MPIPKYGPKAGQYIPESERLDYIRANGRGEMSETPEEALASSNAANRALDPNFQDQTAEEYAADQAAAATRIANERANPRGAPGEQAQPTVPTNTSNAVMESRYGAQQGSRRNAWDDYFAAGAPTRSNVAFDTTNADASRAWQTQMIQDLQQAAAGNPNSRAQQGLQAGYADARAGQSALGSSMRGTGGGAGLRAGAAGAANVQRGFAGDSAMLMNREQVAAQSLLAQQLAAQRGQDGQQAGAMASNALSNTSLEDAMQQFYTQGGIGRDMSNYQYGAGLTSAQLGMDLESKDLEAQRNAALATATATAASAAARWATSGGGDNTTYRQVDGKNSIVPDWDK
jgi:hypothetical protein